MADDEKDVESLGEQITADEFEAESPDEEPEHDAGEPFWESAANAAVQEAVASAEYGLANGTVTLEHETWGNYKDPWFDRRAFSSLDELRQALEEIGESEMIGHVPWENGPVFSTDASAIVDRALEESGITEFFETQMVPSGAELVFGIADALDTERFGPVRIDLEEINAELIKRLAAHPELMYEMDPRRFEELLAELFQGRGYETELTPPSRDGGRDVLAFRKEPFGTLLTLAQAKRYAPDRRVGVRVVRELYGVVEQERASQGVVVTTSSFTKDARAFHERLAYKLALADFNKLVDWLRQHRSRR